MGDLMKWDWKIIGLATLFVTLIIVTVVGNVLIIAAVITTRRLRTVTNCFVMSLAIADWLVGIFVMPLAVFKHLTGEWKMGRIVCMIWVSCDVCVCTASILSLCAISIDRYFAVTQPLVYTRRRRSKRLAASMIICVWVAAILITCPPIILSDSPFLNNSNPNVTSANCDYNQDKVYVVFSAMGSFFVPLIVMIYVYARISLVIATRGRALQALGEPRVKWPPASKNNTTRHVAQNEESDVARESSEGADILGVPSVMTRLPENRRTRSFDNGTRWSSTRRENKAAQTLTIVVGGFIACWLPFFLAYLTKPFITQSAIPDSAMTLLTWLGWINSAINPFIYAFYSPDFRLAFWRLTVRHCTPRQTTCQPIALNNSSRQSMQIRDSLICNNQP